MKKVESANSDEEEEDVEYVANKCIILVLEKGGTKWLQNGCRVDHVASGIAQSFHTTLEFTRTIE